MGDRRDAGEPVLWYGSGYSSSDYETQPTEPDPKPAAPVAGMRTRGSFGPAERLGATGLVAGRFSPLHRGHQYLIEFARASVEKLTVVVFTGPNDAIDAATRVRWIRDLYPDVRVEAVAAKIQPGDADWVQLFAKAVAPFGTAAYFFTSELGYRPVAEAIGATLVPVDPTRMCVPASGSAICANVMENFHYLARSVRPWFVRRIAVVGAESSGKSTLCARLRDQFKTLVVPEWTRVLVQSVPGGLSSDQIQLVARSQIASEDALANQLPDANAGIMLCDTELHTIYLWAKRLFEGEPPQWIRDAIGRRPYDLYLLCAPEIPYVGPPEWDRPADRRAFHDQLRSDLASSNVIAISGTREERFATAADAIIGLFTPRTLLSARGPYIA